MRPLPRHRSLPDMPLVQEICPQPCPGRCKTSLLPEGPLGNETLQCGEQILRFLSLLPLHTATIKIKTLESETRVVFLSPIFMFRNSFASIPTAF